MDDMKTPSIPDVSHLERQFREKLYELQKNTDTLQTTQKELLSTRHALYSTELLLENERRISHELRMQLKAAVNTVNELQQQQAKDQIENVQLRVEYDAMSKQYDSLMNQATTAKAQETECRIKIQALEETFCQKDTITKRLEQALKEFERNNLRTLTAIDDNIAKFKQEHQYLQKSCESIISLNERLQTVGLCTYAIHQKDKRKIKDLECTLISLSASNMKSIVSYDDHPEIKKLHSQDT